jgi:hypothetical protein
MLPPHLDQPLVLSLGDLQAAPRPRDLGDLVEILHAEHDVRAVVALPDHFGDRRQCGVPGPRPAPGRPPERRSVGFASRRRPAGVPRLIERSGSWLVATKPWCIEPTAGARSAGISAAASK